MIQLRLLGGLDLRDREGGEVRALLSQPKRIALLSYLALIRPAGFCRRDTLLALLWPEADSEHARNALRQAIHFLRRTLGQDAVTSRGSEEVGLNPARIWTDARALDEALDHGDLQGAVELYRGELLPGFFVSEAPAFERWLEEERQRLRERSADAAWRLAAQAETAGHASVAVHWGRWASRLTPDDEGALRRLLELCGRLGDRGAAVRAYEEFAERLARELDTAPDPATRTLVGRLREPPTAEHAGVRTASPPAHLPAGPMARQAPRRRLQRRTLFSIAAGLVVVLIATLAAWSRRTVATPALDAVAVFPFSVRGRPDLAYLSDGMVELVSAKLDGAAGLRAIDPRAVAAAVASADTSIPLDQSRGGIIAEQLGARLYVLGGVVEIAGRLQISASLYDRTGPGTPLARATEETDASQVLTVVDRLAAHLLSGRSGADSALARIAAATTTSLPAFRAYLDGERVYRAGQFAQAVDAFQRAIAADTNYALAYYRLATAADWVGNGGLAAQAAEDALRHGDNLSPLVRQLLLGFDAYSEGEPEQAEQIYYGLATTHPDQVEATYMLGETRFHFNAARGRPFTDARAQFERVLALEPGNPHALLHLARIAAAEGRRDEVKALAREFLAGSPDADRALEMRALRAFTLGDAVEQNLVAAQLKEASDVALDEAVRAVAVFAGDPAAAASIAASYTRPGRSPAIAATGHDLVAQFLAARGQWRQARLELGALAQLDRNYALMERTLLTTAPLSPVSSDDAIALRDEIARWQAVPGSLSATALTILHPQVQSYLTALLDARLGDDASVHRAIAALAVPAQAAAYEPAREDLRRSLLAEAASLGGQPQEALRQIEQFRFDPRSILLGNIVALGAHERFLRAELLHALGRDDEALAWYASFPNPNGRDLLYLAPAHLRRAEIYDQQGKWAEAVGHYTRFIELWRDCDPEVRPLVETAQRAVARLQHGR